MTSVQSSRQIHLMTRLWCAVKQDGETGLFVSFCPALGLYSQGRTDQEAKEAIASAIGLYVVACVKKGVVGSMLADHGFQRRPDFNPSDEPTLSKEEFILIKEKSFDEVFPVSVPIPLLIQSQRTV